MRDRSLLDIAVVTDLQISIAEALDRDEVSVGSFRASSQT